MNPAPTGTRIRITSNRFNHSYTIGRVYTVAHVDDDGTFRAADDAGKLGNWLRWSECEPANPSTWARIAADLPEDLVKFLACFDGIGDISLKESVVDVVLTTVPDLHERLVALVGTPAGEPLVAANMPPRPQQSGA